MKSSVPRDPRAGSIPGGVGGARGPAEPRRDVDGSVDANLGEGFLVASKSTPANLRASAAAARAAAAFARAAAASPPRPPISFIAAFAALAGLGPTRQ